MQTLVGTTLQQSTKLTLLGQLFVFHVSRTIWLSNDLINVITFHLRGSLLDACLFLQTYFTFELST